MIERGPFREVAHRLKQRGFYCALQNCDVGEVRGNAVNDSDTLIVAMDGDIEIEFKGATHFPRPGREILVPAWVPHTVRNSGAACSSWIRATQADLAQTD